MNSKTLALSRALPAALGAAAILTLSACNDPGEPSPPPTPAPEQDPAPTTASMPTDLAPTTDTTPPDDATTTAPPPTTAPADDTQTTSAEPAADAPPERTVDSAAEYSLRYLDRVDQVMQNPTPDPFTDFNIEDTCRLCLIWEEHNEERVAAGEKFAEDTMVLGNYVGTLDDVGALLEMEVTQPKVDLVNERGEVVETVEEAEGTFYIDLLWVDGDWVIERLQFGSNEDR